MTCINWVRVRKGARPARFATGDRAVAHDHRFTLVWRAGWASRFFFACLFCFIIGSAEALPILCMRYFRWERERERRKWVRRKWRHHCRAKIGDEITISLAKNSQSWRWVSTFPCQKLALSVSPFTLVHGHFCSVVVGFSISPAPFSPLSKCHSLRKIHTNEVCWLQGDFFVAYTVFSKWKCDTDAVMSDYKRPINNCKSALEAAPLLEGTKPAAHRSSNVGNSKLKYTLTNENN